MAGGRGILDADGRLLIRSDGTVDVCEDCCSVYRQLSKCDGATTSLYVSINDADENDGVIYDGALYIAGSATTLGGGTPLASGDITVQSSSTRYTATFVGVDASACGVCVVSLDGTYSTTFDSVSSGACLHRFTDSSPVYAICGATSFDVRVEITIWPADNSIKQLIVNSPLFPSTNYFNTGTIAQGVSSVGDVLPNTLGNCSSFLSSGGTGQIQFAT